jgi:DNA-binding transcriptional LysR family regulator
MSQPFDLNLLRVFEAILRTNSVSQAGEQLGLTQSGVSNALTRMRSIFSDPLFVPSSEGMLPTPLASRMAEPIRTALSLIQNAAEDRNQFDPATSRRKFTVYMSDVGQMIYLPPLVKLLRADAPGLEVHTVDAVPRDAARLMEQGEIDLAIGYMTPFGEGFHRQLLVNEHFVCLIRESHPLRNTLSVEDYLTADHVVYEPQVRSGIIFDNQVESMCMERGLRRRVALRLSYALGLAEVIANSEYLCAVPSRLARVVAPLTGLRIVALPFGSPHLEVAQQWHDRMHRDIGHAWLRSKMNSILRDHDQTLPKPEGFVNSPPPMQPPYRRRSKKSV